MSRRHQTGVIPKKSIGSGGGGVICDISALLSSFMRPGSLASLQYRDDVYEATERIHPCRSKVYDILKSRKFDDDHKGLNRASM